MAPGEETLGPGVLLDDRYRLVRRLGVGGHGTVWLADDETGVFGQVAVKLLSSRLAESEDVRRRFKVEARILQALQHPGIVRALDFSAYADRLYIVMEFLAGRSLAQEMVGRARNGEMFRLDEVLLRFNQVCDAVAAAHAQGVVHRDLKPQNILVLGDGAEVVTKVLDFGIAKILGRSGEDATTLGRMLGSYLYTSPEQVSSEPIDARADVFALGCVLFEMLTLHRAWAVDEEGRAARVGDRSLRFEGPNTFLSILRRIVAGPRPQPTVYRSGLPEQMDQLVARALEVTPKERYSSVFELQEALREVTTGRHPTVGRPRLPALERSLPRLPVLGSAEISRTGRGGEIADPVPGFKDMGGSPITGLTSLELESSVADTSMLPRPMNQPTALLPSPEAGLRWSAWAGQAGLLIVGVLLGALVYHVSLGARTPPPPAPPTVPAPSVVPKVQVDPRPPVPTARPPTKAPGSDAGVRRAAVRVAPRPTKRAAAPVKPEAHSRVSLRATLESLRGRADVTALAALSDEIQRAASQLEDRNVAARIERLAIASATIGDLEGLGQCIDLLEAARRSKR